MTQVISILPIPALYWSTVYPLPIQAQNRLMAPPFLRRLIRLLFLTSLPLAVMMPACATTSELVKDMSGKPVFEIRFFDQGERYGEYESPEYPNVSGSSLNPAQKKAVTEAVSLWADILGPGSVNTTPAVIHVGTYNNQNADAQSEQNSDATGNAGYTGLAGSLILNRPAEKAALIRIGIDELDFSIPDHLSPIPVTGKWDLVSVLYHEMGHALGILSWAESVDDKWQVQLPSLWDTHLVDKHGTRLAKDMVVVRDRPDGPGGIAGTDFIVGDFNRSDVVFRGNHVSEVLAGALDNALPIEGFECYGDDCFLDLSHIELERGLMSHQNYRNYTTFMEAELATLQDIGYTIDRRNFFGYSVYDDDLTLVNTNGYFARNASGTAYLEGQANTATLGVGLHLYGKRNDVTQAADLLASGTAGTGIRIDGSDNTVRVNSGVLIAADGDWGTGLLVAYGKKHTLISRGDIQAMGNNGIGARFDFGHNVLSDNTEYRGSWIWQSSGTDIPLATHDADGIPLNLDGPLVTRFDVSGKLAGRAAAIYIAENAFVQNIDFMAGADVSGNIVSLWDPDNPAIQYTGNRADLHTALTFGQSADSTGTATTTPDDTFVMALKGGIYGSKSIDMKVAAGRLDVSGTIDVYSLQNNGHLALYGVNADGYGATVTDNFTNSSGATLETAFLSSGKTMGITAGSANLDGTWRIRPAASFYRNGSSVTPEGPVNAPTTVTGQFSLVTLAPAASPTLQFELTDASPDAPAVTVSREADAYSRYADNAGAASVGRILPVLSKQADGDMENLFTALDFSAMNGSDIRSGLLQLTPAAYDTVARESLDNQHEQNMLLLPRLLDTASACPDDPTGKTGISRQCRDWKISVHPVGKYSHMGDHGNRAGYRSAGGGLSVMAEKTGRDGLTVGFDASLSDRRITSLGDYSAKTRTLGGYAGAHAFYKPASWNGAYLTGMARLGIEDVELERRIAINGYKRNHTGKWTGFSGSVLAGVGKDWNLTRNGANLTVGPLGWLEYSVVNRGSLTESGDGASRLHVDSDTAYGLSTALGLHAAALYKPANGSALQWDALAAWRHQWQNRTMHTRATFTGYGDNGFESATDITGRNSLLAQIGLKATDARGRYAQLMAGSEWFGSGTTSAYASVRVGMAF